MYILGINSGFGGGYQDACACIYANGKFLAVVEEERLNKIKYSTGLFPLLAIQEVLSIAKITIQDISIVAFHGSSWQGSIEDDIRTYFMHHFSYCPLIKRFHHHDAHAASTYYLSGFKDALVVTMDNSGDGIASQIMIGKNGKLDLLKRWQRPNSFGTFYSTITQLAGFKRDGDEYKLMGLAPYGNPNRFDFSDFLFNIEQGNYHLNGDYIYPIQNQQAFPNKQIPIYSKILLNRLNLIFTDLKFEEIKKDLAAAAQQHLENVVVKWIKFWIKETGMTNVCLAGGVAMNCVLNQKILERCDVKSIYIPPFASDQGISVGNAILAGIEQHIIPKSNKISAYTGRKFSTNEIIKFLDQNKISYTFLENPIELAADYISNNKIIGWFQGSAEIGARALGNRSILANPMQKGIKDKINNTIKFREDYRPFCPSIILEDAATLFDMQLLEYPYMNITVNCNTKTKELFPDIVHADNTARIQTVTKEINPTFYQLLVTLKQRLGYGIVLNTSLNTRSQPMCYDINDALTTLYTSGLDALFIENILIKK